MITLKAVAIVGDGDTSYENAKDLLDDRIPDGCQVYIPSYIKGPGLKNVFKWLNDYDVPYERVPKDSLLDKLKHTTGLPALIVVGTEGLDSEIAQAYHLGIPVYDLSQALWAVPDPTDEHQMPVHEPESHADETEASSGTSVGVPKDLVLATVSEPRSLETFKQFMLNELPLTREEVKEIVRAAILHHETNWHSAPSTAVGLYQCPSCYGPTESVGQCSRCLSGDIPVQVDASVPESLGLTRYYKSKTGKYRKAGRSKARSGETEVYLTPEEMEAVNGG